MKSLVEFINEAKINESKEILDNIINALEKQNAKLLWKSVTNYVNNNSIEVTKDLDNLESGCLIGYAEKKDEGFSDIVKIAIKLDDSKEWEGLTIKPPKIDKHKYKKVYGDLFGTIYHIAYIEHIPDKLEKIITNFK